MSNGFLVLTLLLATSCVTSSDKTTVIEIVSGKSFISNIDNGPIKIKYDGKNRLEIEKNRNDVSFSANPPAIIYIDNKAKTGIINFGSGSGQVLDLQIIDIESGIARYSPKIRDAFYSYFRSKKCAIVPDSLSLVFQKWDESFITIRAEVFERDNKCWGFSKDKTFYLPDL